MKYFLEVDGNEHEVELVERLGELAVRFDGEPIDVRYVEVDRLGQVALYIGDQSFGVSIEGDEHEAVVTVEGEVYRMEVEDERERAAHRVAKEHGHSADVKSIMPGIVVKVLVEEGATVEEGDALLVLEAMKMQNEIPAPISATVASVHVAEGQTVGNGALLVSLVSKPAEE